MWDTKSEYRNYSFSKAHEAKRVALKSYTLLSTTIVNLEFQNFMQ